MLPYGLEKLRVGNRVFEGNFHHKIRFGKLAVNKILHVVGAAVFEQKEFLRDQVFVFRDPVEGVSVFVQRLVALLQNRCNRPCLPDEDRVHLQCLEICARLIDSFQQIRIVETVHLSGVNNGRYVYGSAHFLVDFLGGYTYGIVFLEPSQHIVRKIDLRYVEDGDSNQDERHSQDENRVSCRDSGNAGKQPVHRCVLDFFFLRSERFHG